MLTSSNPPLWDKINKEKEINNITSAFEKFGLKADQDALWIEWWTKTACLNVGVEIIVAIVGTHYLEELEEDFRGYANCTIRDLIDNLRTSW